MRTFLSERKARWIMPAPCSPTMACFGVVVEVLANDENDFAVAESVGVGKADVGREGDVAGHFLPEIAELVAGVPDVVAGGVDGVLAGCGVVGGAAGYEGAADVGLAVKDADGGIEGAGGAVKVGGRRHLDVCWRAGQSPIRYFGGGGSGRLRRREGWMRCTTGRLAVTAGRADLRARETERNSIARNSIRDRRHVN